MRKDIGKCTDLEVIVRYIRDLDTTALTFSPLLAAVIAREAVSFPGWVTVLGMLLVYLSANGLGDLTLWASCTTAYTFCCYCRRICGSGRSVTFVRRRKESTPSAFAVLALDVFSHVLQSFAHGLVLPVWNVLY
jgi:hypothetical protein